MLESPNLNSLLIYESEQVLYQAGTLRYELEVRRNTHSRQCNLQKSHHFEIEKSVILKLKNRDFRLKNHFLIKLTPAVRASHCAKQPSVRRQRSVGSGDSAA